MTDDPTELFGKIMTPIVVLCVIGIAVEKAFGFVYLRCQAVWEWFREKCLDIWAWIHVHQTTIILILITLGIVLIGVNVLKRYYPRVWEWVKIGCGILLLISMISIASIVYFLMHKS